MDFPDLVVCVGDGCDRIFSLESLYCVSDQKWDAELYEARHNFVWKFGLGLIELLNAQPDERILDVGCGTGQLTARIAETGAKVVGLDSSPEMIGQARQNYPKISFVMESVTQMTFDGEFDAIFSNAALHWVLDADTAASAMSRALRKGGRLVAELGGRGNIQTIECAIVATLRRYLGDHVPPSNNYFPSVSEYTAILERAGFEVRRAELFDRHTPLEGENGMAEWIRQFKWFYFEALPVSQRSEALARVLDELKPVLRNREGWFADYRRLRLLAEKE
jgi:trans-aconitate methyltransferase